MGLPNPVYDDENDKNLSARERAEQQWGMSPVSDEESEGQDLNQAEKAQSRESAINRASSAWGNEAALLKDGEGNEPKDEAEDKTIPFTKEEPKKRNFRGRINKKSGTIGGIVATVGISGFIASSILSGPMQLVHLSQTLMSNFSNQEHASNVRVRGLYRWAKTGNVGETRIGLLGSRMVPKIQANLARSGVIVGADRFTGQITTLTIDASKNPAYRGLTLKETRARIALDNGIDVDRVNQFSGLDGGKFRFNLVDSTVSARRSAIRTHVEGQNLGKIKTALQVRTLGKFYNAPSWMHPLKRVGIRIDQKISKTIQRSKLFKEHEAKRKAKALAKTAAAEARVASVKSKLKIGAGAVGAILLGAQAVCVAKEVAGEIPAINRENIVIPAMKSAVDIIAIGAQIQTGQLPSDGLEQMGTIVKNFEDETGKSIWNAKSLQAQLGTEGGEDINPDIKQAFSPNSTAANIERDLDEQFGADELCSAAGQLIQTVAGFGLLLVPGVGYATAAISAGVGMAAITLVTTFVPRLLANDATLGELHRGPNGGNIDVYGAREVANSAFRSSGGTELSPSESLALKSEHIQKDKEEFQSKSFAQRMFDIYDRRSLAGRLIDKTSPNPSRNFTNIAHFFASNQWLSILSSIFVPKAFATVDYNFGFPEYGLSLNELNDDTLEDPYKNADEAVQLLTNSDMGEELTERAYDCFGVKITKSALGWDAVVSSDVNPSSADYAEADCSDSSDEWRKVKVFVFDSQAMKKIGCYESVDESACEEAGFTTAAASPVYATSTVNTGSSAAYIPDCSVNDGSAAIACAAIDELMGIPYSRERRAAPTVADPVPFLDCSALTGMAVYRTFGTNLGGMASVEYRRNSNFIDIPDLRTVQPGDMIGKGTVATGAGGTGHIAIVVSYDPETKKLVTAETDGRNNPSRIVTTKSLAVDGMGGTYTWAVRYVGPKTLVQGGN